MSFSWTFWNTNIFIVIWVWNNFLKDSLNYSYVVEAMFRALTKSQSIYFKNLNIFAIKALIKDLCTNFLSISFNQGKTHWFLEIVFLLVFLFFFKITFSILYLHIKVHINIVLRLRIKKASFRLNLRFLINLAK